MVAQAGKGNGAAPSAQGGQKFDYDLVIIGAGVGGHGAALHAVESVRQQAGCMRMKLAP